MKTLNKQSCPTCGQSVNMREIGLYTGMVKALCRVWRFCEETDRWENIKASEFRGLMSGVDITRFADWKSMAPEMVNGERGYYNFNRQMLEDYFTGNIKVATKVLRDPLTKQDTLEDYRYVQDLANMKNVEIVVWSGGGQDYAEMWVRRLGLSKYVKRCYDKNHLSADSEGKKHVFNPEITPDIAIDDIQDCTLGNVNLIVREK